MTWIGIAVRASHYYANLSHLFYVRMDGTVRRTEFMGDGTKTEPDPEVCQPLDAKVDLVNSWFDIGAEINDDTFIYRLEIDSEPGEAVTIPKAHLAYIFSQGRVLIQSRNCRVVLRSIRVEQV
jgi:hypothetical protein